LRTLRLRRPRKMLSKPRRAAIYVRVSTEWQTTDNQLLELQRVAEFSGWKVVGIYRDNGVSGGKGRDQRSEFDRLLKDATARRFDVVMAWSLDRLSRSLRDLVSFLGDMRELGRDLYLHKERIDTTTTAGKLMFQVCGAFAEFERETIRERVLAGLARAKAQGRSSAGRGWPVPSKRKFSGCAPGSSAFATSRGRLALGPRSFKGCSETRHRADRPPAPGLVLLQRPGFDRRATSGCTRPCSPAD
jgi:DNA invertase Pin-like site-specific DNA recombinase